MRRARQVLTSHDPYYRTKVETLVQTLQTLKDTEMLFFVDELGPLAVRKYGGRTFVKKGEAVCHTSTPDFKRINGLWSEL